MKYHVDISKKADKVLKKWMKSNPVLYRKYLDVYHELVEHPRTGLGHPHPLVGGNDITYSRHITAHDRIIYNVLDDEVIVVVIQLEDHYDDK